MIFYRINFIIEIIQKVLHRHAFSFFKQYFITQSPKILITSTDSENSSKTFHHKSNFYFSFFFLFQEERQRTGRYLAVGLTLIMLFIAFYHTIMRQTPVLAGLLPPAIIMVLYILWLLYFAKKRKRIQVSFKLFDGALCVFLFNCLASLFFCICCTYFNGSKFYCIFDIRATLTWKLTLETLKCCSNFFFFFFCFADHYSGLNAFRVPHRKRRSINQSKTFSAVYIINICPIEFKRKKN